jgi:hypothetical protein
VEEVSAQELTAALVSERRRLASRVARALATLAGASPVASERAEFAGLLRKEVDRYEDMLESGDAARVLAADGPSRLSARLSSLLSGLESELDRVDASIGQKLHCLDLNRDGKLDRAELAGAAAGLLQEALQGVDLRKVLGDAVFDSEGNIKLADLIALAQENDEQNADSATPTVRFWTHAPLMLRLFLTRKRRRTRSALPPRCYRQSLLAVRRSDWACA